MGLLKPDWKSKNTEKAIQAVERETDQNKLAHIAINAIYSATQRAAINKITNLKRLMIFH